MNDDDVLGTLKNSLSGVHSATPVETIVAAGRSRRRHRLAGLAVAGVAVAAAVAVPALSPSEPAATPGSTNPLRLAAFTVVSNPNGTATVTLVKGPSLNADALSHALAQAGVPAVVRVGSFCRSAHQPAGLDQVLGSQRRADGTVVLVIMPSAMPDGAKLSIGFKPKSSPGKKDRVQFTLVSGGRLSCSSFR